MHKNLQNLDETSQNKNCLKMKLHICPTRVVNYPCQTYDDRRTSHIYYDNIWWNKNRNATINLLISFLYIRCSDCIIIDMKHVIITFIKVLIFSLCFGKDTLSRLSCAKYVNNSWNERSIATEKIVKYCTLSRLHIENKIRSLLFFNESYFYNSMSVFVCFCVWTEKCCEKKLIEEDKCVIPIKRITIKDILFLSVLCIFRFIRIRLNAKNIRIDEIKCKFC